MNEAIRLAVEKGGYSLEELANRLGITNVRQIEIGKKYVSVSSQQGNTKQLCSFETLFLDPKFWQVLGKALGWGICCDENGHKPFGAKLNELCKVRDMCDGLIIEEYLYHAHQYFDLVLTGGDVEAFWQELLKDKDD